MDYELITDWTRHDEGVVALLAAARRSVRVFDDDLSRLKLDRPENAESLRRLLAEEPRSAISIFVRNAESLQRNSPRILGLLTTYAHRMEIRQSPPHLSSLRDCLLIVDDVHALVRFDQSQPRAKLLTDNAAEVGPYLRRIDDVANEGGDIVSATTLGL
jgi:hypothetical protein